MNKAGVIFYIVGMRLYFSDRIAYNEAGQTAVKHKIMRKRGKSDVQRDETQ